MVDDEDPNAMDDWGNAKEVGSDSDNDDDMLDDSSEEDSDEEVSDNDEDGIVTRQDDEIVEKFIRSFSNGDYDIEFDNALRLDRHVPSSFRPTQALYIKPDNWRERNRLGLERVKERLQTCINVSRGKRFKLYLAHNNGWDYEIEDNEAPIVWHEAILDEYWDQLEEKIDERKQLGIVTKIAGTIHIQNVEMSKERLATLVTTLSGQVNKTETIIFIITSTHVRRALYIVSLSKLVDVSSQLQTFCLRHNRIDNMDSARCISKSLKSHGCIDSLHLTNCDLGNSLEILSVILQSDVRRINLRKNNRKNNIDSLGAFKIAEYLENDLPIECIELDCNRLNDNDAILISQALKRNTNLLLIDLALNNFTSTGVKALLNYVFDSSTLNAISESNHSLTGIHMFYSRNHNLQGCIDRMLEMNRAQKIVLALQDKDQ